MVNCPLCEQPVDWVTMSQAAEILKVSNPRVLQFINSDRLPGATKHTPRFGVQPLWKIPIKSVVALHQSRLREQGLML